MDTRAILNGPQLANTDYILSTLSDDILACPRDFALILDDYHLIRLPEIHNLVTGLVEQLPERLHLILLSR